MKALFITTDTNEGTLLLDAWQGYANVAPKHVVFDIMEPPKDDELMATAKEYAPDVVFYLGANVGLGLPAYSTFKQLRNDAVVVHLCWDAADLPWWSELAEYAKQECFDLQVSLDGCRTAPVDMATPPPISRALFDRKRQRDIACGFSGQIVDQDGVPRTVIIRSLAERNLITVRKRERGSYSEHVDFLCRCVIALNTSWCGSGQRHHLKIRVMEAAWAGAALLEPEASPIDDWFPRDSFFSYRDADEAAQIIRIARPYELEERVARFTAHAERYTPQKVYAGILTRAGLL